jgi:signal transduction histidine kinase
LPQRPPRLEGWQHARRGPPVFATQLADGRWLAVRPARERRGGPPWMGTFRGPLGVLFVLTLVFVAIGVGAYLVVRALTRRLERLQAGVEALGEGRLSERVAVEGRDEVAALAESFNRAATRIESLVQAHKSLLANASHELRTPLTRVRMALELGKDRREIERDIAELDHLIDEILLASRLDAVGGLDGVEEVDLLALAAEECARYEGVEVSGEPVVVRGDPRLLRRMIRNLLDNATRHGVAPVSVSVRKGELRVCDSGGGVPEAERERVFEPFYRAPGARARGAGLGLSLVRQIARRHGGEALCEGNCFAVRLATPA